MQQPPTPTPTSTPTLRGPAGVGRASGRAGRSSAYRFTDSVYSDILKGPGGRSAEIPVDFETAMKRGISHEMWRRATHVNGVRVVFPLDASPGGGGAGRGAGLSSSGPRGDSRQAVAGTLLAFAFRSPPRGSPSIVQISQLQHPPGIPPFYLVQAALQASPRSPSTVTT